MASQQIIMPAIDCNRTYHKGEKVRSLCLREECKKQSAQCCKCTLELHKDCVYQTIMIDDVQKMVQPLFQIKFDLIALQQLISSQIQTFISSIEDIWKPISCYIENPNLSNLNQIGNFLKTQVQVIQMTEIEKVEQIITNLFVDIKNKFSIEISLKQRYGMDESKQSIIVEELINQGDALFELKDYQKAMKCYQQVSLIDPKNIVSWNNQGNVLYNQEKYQQAIEFYKQAIQIDPQDIQAWLNEGDALFEQENYDEAISCYQQVIDIDPNSSIGWNMMGRALFNLDQQEEALKCQEQALKINPNYIKAWLDKGDTLDKLMESNEAMQCFEQATSIDPNNQIAWNYKGDALFKLQQYEEAIQCYQYMIKIDPTNHVAWNNKGYALFKLKKCEEAFKFYEQAIKLYPKYINAWLNKGETLAYLENYEEALQIYLQVINMHPNNSSAHKSIQKILDQLSRCEEENFEEIIIDPNSLVDQNYCYNQVYTDYGYEDTIIRSYYQVNQLYKQKCESESETEWDEGWL